MVSDYAATHKAEALEARGVKDVIRIPSNDSLERNIEELLTRPVGRVWGESRGATPTRSVAPSRSEPATGCIPGGLVARCPSARNLKWKFRLDRLRWPE